MDDWQQLVDDCVARESRLNDWERTFIASIASQLDEGRPLTKPQSDKLNDIWENATSKG